MKHRREIFILAMCVLDIMLINYAFGLAFWLRDNFSFFNVPAGVGSPNLYRFIYPVILFSWLIILSLMRQYEPRRRWGSGEIVISIFIAITLGAIFILAYAYTVHHIYFSRLVLFYLWGISIVFLIAARFLIKSGLIWLGFKGILIKKIIIVGWGEAALALAKEYKMHPEMLYSVRGFILDEEEKKKLSGDDMEKINVFSDKGIVSDVDGLIDIVEKEGIQLVIITSFLEQKRLKQVIENLECRGVIVKIVPNLYDIAPRNMEFAQIGDVPVIGFSEIPMQGWESIAKRIVDIMGAVIGLCVLAPLFLIVAILIKRESPGPVFFSQERIGQNGRLFKIYKFRSMKAEAAAGPPVKVTGKIDSRITRIGHFIRTTSIDELPQLFNVLKGDMSLVGPRPETYLYVSQYTDWNKRRLYLRPGLTGLAQALGVRGNTPIDKKTKYDLEYMRNQSFWLDIKILFLTVINLLRHKEAY